MTKFAKGILMLVSIFLTLNINSFCYANSTVLDKANILNEMDLLKGTEKGYELDRKPTRIEGAIMMLRILGKEPEALSQNNTHPFADVPSWASPYIGYLYKNDIVRGLSLNEYGATESITAKQYAALVLRALGYQEVYGDFSFDNSLLKAVEVGLLNSAEIEILTTSTNHFNRSDLVTMSYNSLTVKIKGKDISLIQYLVDNEKSIPLHKAITSGLYADGIINFEDSNLEQVIRQKIGKISGDILKSDLVKITELNAVNKNIHSLKGLNYLSNLEKVELAFNKIEDISEIKNLSKLTWFECGYNKLTDISVIRYLRNIKQLFLPGNQISDITGIGAGKTSIPSLDLSNNKIKDISALKGITTLGYLNLSNNCIEDISPLSDTKDIISLYLNNNNISSIAVLRNKNLLRYLDIRYNKDIDVSLILSLKNLFNLKLDGYNIKGIEELNLNQNLNSIDIFGIYINQKSDFKYINETLNKADSIISSTIRPEMTDYEKVLAIHDYIVNNTEYDIESYRKNSRLPVWEQSTSWDENIIHMSYGVLVKNIGVCDGYTNAMYLLLNRIGIECKFVTNGEHTWNIVKINNKYHHIDTTWDDPYIPDGKSILSHNYFLVGDEKISRDHIWNKDNYPRCEDYEV